MSIGVKIGPEIGVQIGPTIGQAGTPPLTGVDQDATSSLYRPADATQWAAFNTYYGLDSDVPDEGWLCQDTGPGIADAIDSKSMAEFADTPLYQQAVAGQTALGVGFVAGTAQSLSVAVSNINAQDVFWLGYCALLAAPATERTFWYLGNARIQVTADPFYRVYSDAGNSQTGLVAIGTALRPVGILHKSGVSKLYTDSEIITAPAGAPAGTTMFLGGVSASAPGMRLAGAWRWIAAKATAMDDARIRSLYEALGFAVAW